MNVRIESRDKFELFGIERIFKQNKANRIPDFWAECHKNGSYDKLLSDAGSETLESACPINAVCGYRRTENNTFPYMICALRGKDSRAAGYIITEVPTSDWAVFRSSGANPLAEISELTRCAYKEWLPTSGYDLGDAPDMELYYGENGNCTAVEIWISVKKAAYN